MAIKNSKSEQKTFKRHYVRHGGSRMPVIGTTEYVSIDDTYIHVPAKVDTGADSSSIWASSINVTEDGTLEFKLFDEKSDFYDGKTYSRKLGEYKVAALRNSTGEEHIRYRVLIPMSLGGKNINASFTLADRSKNAMPILIGRRTISKKFLVDVSFNPTGRRLSFVKKNKRLTEELNKDPRSFHVKYKINRKKNS